jgi:hypothetical protein
LSRGTSETSRSSSSSTDSSSNDEEIVDLNEMLANLDIEDHQVIILLLFLIKFLYYVI